MISIIHFYLYGMLKRKMRGGNIIHISQINPIIRWTIRIPKKYMLDIIDELIECNLIKKLKKDNYEIITINRNPLRDSLGEPLW